MHLQSVETVDTDTTLTSSKNPKPDHDHTNTLLPSGRMVGAKADPRLACEEQVGQPPDHDYSPDLQRSKEYTTKNVPRNKLV